MAHMRIYESVPVVADCEASGKGIDQAEKRRKTVSSGSTFGDSDGFA